MTTNNTRKRPSPEALRQKVAEQLGLKRPVSIPYQVCLNSRLADKLTEANHELDIARIRLETQPDVPERTSEYTKAKAAVETLKEKARPHLLDIAFVNIGALEWERLVDANSITDEERENLKEQGQRVTQPWSPHKFPPVAIAHCAVVVDEDGEPLYDEDGKPVTIWTVEQVQAMFDDPAWSTGELMSMFVTANEANNARKVADLGKDSASTPT